MNIEPYSVLPAKESLPDREHDGNTTAHSFQTAFAAKTDNRNGSESPGKRRETEDREGLLKLNPYPIFDTDPPLNSSNYTRTHVSIRSARNKTNVRSVRRGTVDPADRKGLTNVDRHNYTTIKKYEIHVGQSSGRQRQRKIVQTIPSKSPPVPAKKAGGPYPTTNGRRINRNSASNVLVDRLNRKMTLDHVHVPTRTAGCTSEPTKHVKDVRGPNETSTNGDDDRERDADCRTDPKRKIIPDNDDAAERVKLSDRNDDKLGVNGKSRFDRTNPSNNNYAFGSSTQNTQYGFKFSIAQTIKENIEHKILMNGSNRSTVDHLILGNGNIASRLKYNSGQHSALRRSLFSNVPPYIRFSSHDIKGESFPLVLQKFLKWKLSSVTPIVVRRTIENSGFKLVRSEYSLNSHHNNNNNHNNHNNNPSSSMSVVQCGVSIQNHCGVTPPIVDAFCGVAVQPNELMMLPRSQSNDWVGTWGSHMKAVGFKGLCEQQKLNHFPGTFQIGRKDRLWKNLYRLILKHGNEQFGFIPKSYILPQEIKFLRQVFDKSAADKWIIKPPASARGSGIRVVSKWNEIPKNVSLVVQRYIDNPYLINDSKFDLRLYILVTSINPLRVYLYDNGLVRFASVKYSTDVNSISDRYMHLTNYSINRLNSQYTQNEDADVCQGHKWTLRSLWTYMETERKIDVKKLWDGLVDLAVKTVISGESPVYQMCLSNLNNRYNAYELFGIDVLFDEYLKPWILEVNISPSLHSSSKLDLAVKGPLIKDLMNMVGYQIPNKMSPSTNNTLLKVLGFSSPLTFDERLYTLNLSAREREKQEYYTNIKCRENYVNCILDDLLPDDVRHLVLYEDELSQIGSFVKVFPTTTSHKYHQYFDDARYYNMLLDAWENKYSDNREEGIAVLENLCQLKVHLEVPEIEEKPEQPEQPIDAPDVLTD